MHTSTNEHIIIHFQNIKNENFIRIITVANTDDYFKEIKTVYGQDESVNNECISLFYNCVELYDRIICDLGFKKFKGIEKIEKILPGLWQVYQSNDSDIISWFKNTYLSWVKSRLNMYIEDLDEDKYFDCWNIKWNKLEAKEYVKIQYLEDLSNTNYELLGCEKTKDGSFVFTRNHLLSLVSFYINNNYSKVLAPFEIKEMNIITPLDNEKKEKSTLIINDCDYLRGLTLDRTVLSTIDVEEIFKSLFVTNGTLACIAKSKDFIASSEDEISNQFNNLCETQIFGGFYSFIDNSFGLQSEGDIEDVFKMLERDSYKTSTKPRDVGVLSFKPDEIHPTTLDLIKKTFPDSGDEDFVNELIKKAIPTTISNIMLLAPSRERDIIPPPQIEKTKMLFKNLITNVVHAYDTNIKLLKELEMLSSYTYKNAFTSKVIESLEEISLSRPLINELKELISILDNVNFEDAEGDDKTVLKQPLETNIQRLLTDGYVKSYKNDKAETVASTVIENIYNFLTPLKPIDEQINRNQIGRDLVDLGVKKTRKAKGFVYGIEDSGHTEKKTTSITSNPGQDVAWKYPEWGLDPHELKTTPKELSMKFNNFQVDESKVIKNNKQIRSEPSVPVNEDLLKINTPSKYFSLPSPPAISGPGVKQQHRII